MELARWLIALVGCFLGIYATSRYGAPWLLAGYALAGVVLVVFLLTRRLLRLFR